jgi:hypothetical protein
MTTVPVVSRLFFYAAAAAVIAGVTMAPKAHAAVQAPHAAAVIAARA